MADITGHGLKSILGYLKEAPSRIKRSMSSSLKYQQSKQAAQRNSTSEREAISEKPEEDVMKPLAYQSSKEANFLWELRKYVLLQVMLAATITYSAGLSPPGGFWPDNSNNIDGGHLAGDPVLQVTYVRRYVVFFYFNATAFVASFVTVNLLLVHSLSHRRWWLRALQAAIILNQLGLMGSYAAGSYREVPKSAYVLALVAMVFSYVCAHVLCFALWALRARHGGSKSPTAAAPEDMERTRKNLLIFATLVATVTYQAGLSTPGGLVSSDIPDQGHLLGDPMLRGHRFTAFFYLNSTAFVASLVIIMLLMSRTVTSHGFRSCALWVCTSVALVGLTGAFAIGSSRSVKTSIYVVALVAAVLLYIGLQILVFLCEPVGIWLGNAKATLRKFLKLDQFPLQGDQQVQGLSEQLKLLKKSRMYLLLLGILAASVTYQAGLDPPGGFCQSNATDGLHNYLAGTWAQHLGAFAAGSSRKVYSLQRHTAADTEAQDPWDKKLPKYLLLLAALAAAVTYQAAMNPPGGLWGDGQAGHIAGDPVLRSTYPCRYKAFFYSNATSFMASLVIMVLLLIKRVSREQSAILALHAAMILDLFGLMGAYAAGSSRRFRTSVYILALLVGVSTFVAGGSSWQVSKFVYTSVIVVSVFLYVGIHVLLFKLEVFPNHSTWKEIWKHKLLESMPKWLKKLFETQTEEEDEEMKWKLQKSQKVLLLLAILSASITYQASMSPRGGIWLQNNTAHAVGNPVLQTGHAAFIASIFIVSSLRWWLWTLCIFCFMVAFSAARSYWTLAISWLFALDGNKKFLKLFDTSESEDHLDPALSDPRETELRRNYQFLLAILAVSITYQTGLNPPGGFWQANATDGHHYGASDPVVHTTHHRRYVFFYCNATAFMASLVILILLLSNFSRTRGIKNCALRVAMILDLFGLIGAFAAGSRRKSKLEINRDHPNRPVKRNNPREATWRVASAAPHHMTGNQSLLLACLHNGDDGECIVVHPATNREVPLRVQGSGSVRTESMALDDVWYVPGLDSNLVSSGQLARQGCAISLGPSGCSISRGGALVGTARFTEACQFELDYLKIA